MKTGTTLLWVAGWLVVQTISARASLTFASSATNAATGNWLSASATFDLVNQGTQLQLTLANVGSPVRDASDVLTAVFFDLAGVDKLTPVSAVLSSDSVLLGPGWQGNRAVGDYWQYLGNITQIPGGPHHGISATSLGLFTRGNFSAQGQNLHDVDYGLVNGLSSSASPLLRNMRLEQNSVVFTLSGLPADFSLSDISNVEFQYGTSLVDGQPSLVAYVVPEPATGALLLFSGGMLLLLRRPRI